MAPTSQAAVGVGTLSPPGPSVPSRLSAEYAGWVPRKGGQWENGGNLTGDVSCGPFSWLSLPYTQEAASVGSELGQGNAFPGPFVQVLAESLLLGRDRKLWLLGTPV